MLATLYAAGLLTTINVPDEEHEAIRSALRCRGDLTETIARTKQRILAFLLSRGFRYPGKTHWTKAFRAWVCALSMAEWDQITLQTYLYQLDQLEQEVRRLEVDLAALANEARYEAPVKVLMAFRGIGLVSALTLIFELGDIRRFAHPRQLMAYLGLVPSEHSSGKSHETGRHYQNRKCPCAKNCHLRRMEVYQAPTMQSGAKRTATSGVCGGRQRYLESATPTVQTL